MEPPSSREFLPSVVYPPSLGFPFTVGLTVGVFFCAPRAGLRFLCLSCLRVLVPLVAEVAAAEVVRKDGRTEDSDTFHRSFGGIRRFGGKIPTIFLGPSLRLLPGTRGKQRGLGATPVRPAVQPDPLGGDARRAPGRQRPIFESNPLIFVLDTPHSFFSESIICFCFFACRKKVARHSCSSRQWVRITPSPRFSGIRDPRVPEPDPRAADPLRHIRFPPHPIRGPVWQTAPRDQIRNASELFFGSVFYVSQGVGAVWIPPRTPWGFESSFAHWFHSPHILIISHASTPVDAVSLPQSPPPPRITSPLT